MVMFIQKKKRKNEKTHVHLHASERRFNIWLSGVWIVIVLNITKIKEIVVDYRRARKTTPPLHINGDEVERINNFKFLCQHLTKDLTWTINTFHSAEDFLSNEAQEGQCNIPALSKFLQEHDKEHSLSLHHSVAHQLRCREPERP